MRKFWKLLAVSVLAAMVLVACSGEVVDDNDDQGYDEIEILDLAIFNGFADDEHILLELDGGMEYDKFAVNEDVMAMLKEADFAVGTQLRVHYWATEIPTVVQIRHNSPGAGLLIAAGTIDAFFADTMIIAIESNDKTVEYNVAVGVWEELNQRYAVGDHIVAFYSQGATDTVGTIQELQQDAE